MVTFTAREFNQDVSAAKRAAASGPVVVTDRGAPAFVLLSYDEYMRHVDPSGAGLLERLTMGEDEYVEDFDVPSLVLDVPEL